MAGEEEENEVVDRGEARGEERDSMPETLSCVCMRARR